jgi:hypothetical protein
LATSATTYATITLTRLGRNPDVDLDGVVSVERLCAATRRPTSGSAAELGTANEGFFVPIRRNGVVTIAGAGAVLAGHRRDVPLGCLYRR